MDILLANLNDDRARISQQVARGGESLPKICEIAVDAESPSIAVRLDLLGFSSNGRVVRLLRRAVRDARLKIGVKVDAVGRINVSELHLAGHALPLEETRHRDQ